MKATQGGLETAHAGSHTNRLLWMAWRMCRDMIYTASMCSSCQPLCTHLHALAIAFYVNTISLHHIWQWSSLSDNETEIRCRLRGLIKAQVWCPSMKVDCELRGQRMSLQPTSPMMWENKSSISIIRVNQGVKELAAQFMYEAAVPLRPCTKEPPSQAMY
eukprot:607122-Pelagomonas_calceolata.AAC.4